MTEPIGIHKTGEWSISLFRWVGYGLLVLALFDFIAILVPPQLMNPTWEFQTIGALVERVPVPLLGLVLVFSGASQRGRFERTVLKFLSWASLLIGVVYLLLIPLAVSNTRRINDQTNTQILVQANQQTSRIQQVKGQVSKATPNQIEAFLRSRGRSLADQNPQTVKRQLLSELTQAEKWVKTQSQANQANTRLVLLKNLLKWALGALVSGALFIGIWGTTRKMLRIR